MSIRATPETEASFQRQVIDLGRLLGWKVAHFRASMNAAGKWSTAVQGDGAGFPDLVMVKTTGPGELRRVIYVELKCGRNMPSIAQCEWLAWLKNAGQEVYIFRPSQWDELVKVLT